MKCCADDAEVKTIILVLWVFFLLRECDFPWNKVHGTNPTESKWANLRNTLYIYILHYINIKKKEFQICEEKVNPHFH